MYFSQVQNLGVFALMTTVIWTEQTHAHPWRHQSWNTISTEVNATEVVLNRTLSLPNSGSAKVINNCSFGIISNIVHGPRPGAPGPPEEISNTMMPGESLSHPFQHDPRMGVAWKLVRNDEQGRGSGPVQLEWTWVPEQNRTYWDLSMIDAHSGEIVDSVNRRTEPAEKFTPANAHDGIVHPFAGLGMNVAVVGNGDKKVNPTVGGHNCVPVHCPKASSVCVEAYNFPEDWAQQHDCADFVNLVLTLCG